MITIEPFEATHLAELSPQLAQAVDVVLHDARTPGYLAGAGPCFTARDTAGRILLCAGMIENFPHYATAWALLCDDKRADLVGLTRAIRRVLDATAYRRIDMQVRTAFEPGHAWARHLGFSREGTLRAYGAQGEDFDVYARVREIG